MNILEWINTFLLLIYICLYTWINQDLFQHLAVAITYTDPSCAASPIVAYVSTGSDAKKDFEEGNAKIGCTIVTAELVK